MQARLKAGQKGSVHAIELHLTSRGERENKKKKGLKDAQNEDPKTIRKGVQEYGKLRWRGNR